MVTTKAKSSGRRLMPNIRIGGAGLDVAALRTMAQNEPAAFMAKVDGLINPPEGQSIPGTRTGRLRWGDMRDLRKLFLSLADVEVAASFDMLGEQRAIQASAFPLLSGALTVAGINDAYEAQPTIGQELVTEDENAKRFAVYANLTSEDTAKDTVDEGKEDYPEIGAGEEKFEIRSKHNGRRISITAATIEENDVSDIVRRINALAEISNEFVEEQTLRRACDIDGSGTSPAEPYTLRLNGVGTALYQTVNTTLTRLGASGNRAINNALVDTTDLQNVRALLVAMKNSRGKRINIPISRCILLVPDALVGVAGKILNSEYESGIENEISNWGPRGRWRPRLLSSPKLDDLSTTVWYLGDFKRQLIRKWKLRFEYVTLTGITEAYVRRRIAFQARFAWDVEIGATDYVYVVQSLPATTAP